MYSLATHKADDLRITDDLFLLQHPFTSSLACLPPSKPRPCTVPRSCNTLSECEDMGSGRVWPCPRGLPRLDLYPDFLQDSPVPSRLVPGNLHCHVDQCCSILSALYEQTASGCLHPYSFWDVRWRVCLKRSSSVGCPVTQSNTLASNSISSGNLSTASSSQAESSLQCHFILPSAGATCNCVILCQEVIWSWVNTLIISFRTAREHRMEQTLSMSGFSDEGAVVPSAQTALFGSMPLSAYMNIFYDVCVVERKKTTLSLSHVILWQLFSSNTYFSERSRVVPSPDAFIGVIFYCASIQSWGITDWAGGDDALRSRGRLQGNGRNI